VDITDVLRLEPHGPDTWVGTGPQYEWGGLYGGQIVAQALRAAAASVAEGFVPHSMRAYFIRAGDHTAPVRYEVDRPRDGKSFCTRRVIARQALVMQGGAATAPGDTEAGVLHHQAILNLEASFTVAEESESIQTVELEPVPAPEELPAGQSWTSLFERRFVEGTDARGRVQAWVRLTTELGEDPLLQACALAFISDDFPTDAVIRAHPIGQWTAEDMYEGVFTASLDHTIWFHRPLRTDEWHLHDVSCHGFSNGRGLAIGNVFRADGTHVATVAQEVLLREQRA
jgi:acyl-CoA thioesterase-2